MRLKGWRKESGKGRKRKRGQKTPTLSRHIRRAHAEEGHVRPTGDGSPGPARPSSCSFSDKIPKRPYLTGRQRERRNTANAMPTYQRCSVLGNGLEGRSNLPAQMKCRQAVSVVMSYVWSVNGRRAEREISNRKRCDEMLASSVTIYVVKTLYETHSSREANPDI